MTEVESIWAKLGTVPPCECGNCHGSYVAPQEFGSSRCPLCEHVNDHALQKWGQMLAEKLAR